jgi:excisionase family DNA binding protein
MSDRMLTPEEVAERLAVTPNTVRGWLREGTLRGVKLGKRVWRINENDLHMYICCEQQTDYCVEVPGEQLTDADKRALLAEALHKESQLVREDSLSVLKEFEDLDDED